MKGLYWTTSRRQALERELRRTSDAALFKRLLALAQIDQGRPISQVADELGVNRRSVYRWIERFEAEKRPKALERKPGQGRPPKAGPELESLLESALAQPPLELGYPANGWTLPLLQAFVAVHLPGTEVSFSTLRRLLHKKRYVWKRFRYVLAPDPQAAKKNGEILAKIKALPARTALLAEDETDLLLFPPLRSGWALRGKAAPVLISGFNARLTVFGALHLRSGNMLLLDQKRKRTEEFLEFLDLVRWHYRGWPVAMLLDENSIHTSEQSLCLAEELDIQLIFLPVRSPHLNPLDQIWGHGKEAVCANVQQGVIEDQVTYFEGYYRDLSSRERLLKAGMFSPTYWLHQV